MVLENLSEDVQTNHLLQLQPSRPILHGMEWLHEQWQQLAPQSDYSLWTQVLGVVLATALVAFIVGIILNQLLKKAGNTNNNWDDALFCSAKRPAQLVVWALGLSVAARMSFDAEDDSTLYSFITPIREVLILIAGTWFAWRFSKHLERNLVASYYADRISMDETTIHAVSKIFRLAIIITTVLAGMKTLGFSISGLLAAGGVGGLVIGMASKDLLANFFGALMIYLDKPFKVGDWIRSPDREIEGTVEEIGWRQTRIRTFDKRPLYVPNSIFTTISIENPSRMKNRRIREVVGVRYDDMSQVSAIASGIEDMLKNHPDIDQNQTLFVHLIQFNSSSVDILIYTFTKTTEWVPFQGIKQDVLLKIAEVIESHKGEIAFPTQTLHVATLPQEQGQ